jgi:uncharacterized cupin superfamily protein
MTQPVVNIADLTLESWSEGTKFAGSDTSFGPAIGMAGMGISYNEVPPGKSGCPFHNHHLEDELFYVISGTGTYRFGTESHPIKSGDVLGAPAGGRDTAHQIINTGTEPLRFLGVSTKVPAEVVEYPDSEKFLVSSWPGGNRASRFRYVNQIGPSVDYWQGEDIGEAK